MDEREWAQLPLRQAYKYLRDETPWFTRTIRRVWVAACLRKMGHRFQADPESFKVGLDTLESYCLGEAELDVTEKAFRVGNFMGQKILIGTEAGLRDVESYLLDASRNTWGMRLLLDITGNPFRRHLFHMPVFQRPRECGFVDQDLACYGCGSRPARDGTCRVVEEQKGAARKFFFDPAWRSADAISLARATLKERDFTRLSLLGDALEEAGCTLPVVLEHCRSEFNNHTLGCWVLRLILPELCGS